MTLATDLNVAFTTSDNGILAFGDNRITRERFVWLGEHGQITVGGRRSARSAVELRPLA